MNYVELYDAVVSTTENTDPTFLANIPIFVANAEKRIYQAVKIPNLRKNTTMNTPAASPYLTVPTDYLATWELAAIASGAYAYLLPKDVSFIREAYPVVGTTGTPKYYAQFNDTTLLLGPTPAIETQMEMHYFYYPESIVTASTTWLGTNFDNALLYGVLVEAAVFMKSEEDTVKAYAEQYTVNLKLLKGYADGKLSSGDYRR